MREVSIIEEKILVVDDEKGIVDAIKFCPESRG
jgi:hypothetical protein